MIGSIPTGEISNRDQLFEFFSDSYKSRMVPREEFEEAYDRNDGVLYYIVHDNKLLAGVITHADRIVHTGTSPHGHWRRGLYVHLTQAMQTIRPGLHRTVSTKMANKIDPLLQECGFRPITAAEIDHPVLDKFKEQGREISEQEGLITIGYNRPSAEPGGSQFVYLDRAAESK